MQKIFRLLSAFFVFLLFFTKVALADDTLFKVDSVNGTSVNLSWKKDLSTNFKQIYYGTEKFQETTGAEEQTEVIEGNKYIYKIDNLENNKKYYFQLVLFDANGNITSSSDILESKIGNGTIEKSSLKLEKVEQLKQKQIKLYFSEELDSTQEILNSNFKIENIKDSTEFLSVSEQGKELNTIEGKTLILNLNEEIPVGQEYKVLVFGVLNADGTSIENGVNAEVAFVGKDFSEPKEVEQEPKKVEEVETNSADDKGTHKIGGKDVDENKIKKDIVGEANKKAKNNGETETETGPETYLIIILTLIIGILFFLPRYAKK